ncbi:hypothetical protein GYMLUDRAFT_242318 [Collybiopsis luxurians FD-317 M1]|uniref:Uncharacterized protein n=1 Tax=Collybiopsis luxurians FD-317 M1 TaxID=944289 RepID=A0A0D0C3H7_9AGAR|nr:hypothetical protein GYMLUDRAFT_242318 [Collybiopsis luxurians FD-317 M1]
MSVVPDFCIHRKLKTSFVQVFICFRTPSPWMTTILGASVLGLLLTGCHVVLTRKQEREYIWKRPLRLTVVRGLYVLVRYVAIIIHVGEIILASVIIAGTGESKQTPEHLCLSLVIFRLVSLQSMLLILHLILMLRVFALYNQSLPVGIFLLVLAVVGCAGLTASMVRAFIRIKIKFTGFCVPNLTMTVRRKNPILYLVFGEIVIQLILLGLAWKRTIWDFRHITFFRPALISVLNRDGLKIFAGISGISVSSCHFSYLRRLTQPLVALVAIGVAVLKRGGTPAVFIFPILISFISVSGTRTILNLQALSHEAPSTSSPGSSKGVEFTSINLTRWEEPWSTSTFLEIEHIVCGECDDDHAYSNTAIVYASSTFGLRHHSDGSQPAFSSSSTFRGKSCFPVGNSNGSMTLTSVSTQTPPFGSAPGMSITKERPVGSGRR